MLKKVLGYKKDIDQKCFWHERSALQSVGVRRSTGNDVSGFVFFLVNLEYVGNFAYLYCIF